MLFSLLYTLAGSEGARVKEVGCLLGRKGDGTFVL